MGEGLYYDGIDGCGAVFSFSLFCSKRANERTDMREKALMRKEQEGKRKISRMRDFIIIRQ